MNTAAPLPLTSAELNSLESLLFCATERELSRIQELLTGTESITATAMPTETEWQAQVEANLRKYCPHTPWPKQRLVLSLKCREILFGGAKGPGKLLALDTPIATPDGWRPLSEIHPGSTVFGRDGKPCAVTYESPVVTASGWLLTFDDGSTVIAHDEHRWLTFDSKELAQLTRLDPAWRAKRRATRKSRSSIGAGTKWNHTREHREFLSRQASERNRLTATARIPLPSGTVRTTAEIVETLLTHRGYTNHAIPVAAPLELPDRDLPIDPYLLGAWLGDGTTTAGSITTADPEIVSA